MKMLRFLWLCLNLSGFAVLALAKPLSINPDEVAQGLAGLKAVPGMAGFSASDFARYKAGIDAGWARYMDRIGTPMREWAGAELPASTNVLFYPFSGPDFPTAFILFPEMRRYVLVANQVAGQPVVPANFKPAESKRLFDMYAEAWAKFGQLGFFRTNDLVRDAQTPGKRINPTDILMAFAARLGFRVLSVSPLTVLDTGDTREEAADSAANWNSVRLRLKKDEREVLLDYVFMDLSDPGLAGRPENLSFARENARHVVLLKAASHLPQASNFSSIRDAIVEGAECVIQDETGIEYGLLARHFQTALHGQFSRPHILFNQNAQRDLARAYRDGKPRPLKFRIGYEKAGGSALQIALREKEDAKPSRARDHKDRSEEARLFANGRELAAKILTGMRFEAEVSQRIDEYNKRPKGKYLGAGAVEYAGAAYFDAWARKIEAIGILDFSAQSKGNSSGKVTLWVELQQNGDLKNVEIRQSSGIRNLDDAALRIVRAGAPYGKIPPAIIGESAFIGFARTLSFTNENPLRAN